MGSAIFDHLRESGNERIYKAFHSRPQRVKGLKCCRVLFVSNAATEPQTEVKACAVNRKTPARYKRGCCGVEQAWLVGRVTLPVVVLIGDESAALPARQTWFT